MYSRFVSGDLPLFLSNFFNIFTIFFLSENTQSWFTQPRLPLHWDCVEWVGECEQQGWKRKFVLGMHAISVNGSSCKLWAYTSVWYENAQPERKMSKSICNLYINLGPWSPWTWLSDEPAPIRRERAWLCWTLRFCRSADIFCFSNTERMTTSSPRIQKISVVSNFHFSHTSINVCLLVFPCSSVSLFSRKMPQKNKRKEMSSASWRSAEMFVIYRWRLRSGSKLTSGLGDPHQALWSRFPRRNVWGFLALKKGPKYITLASTIEQGGMYLWHTHKYNHTHTCYSRGQRGPMLDADDDKSVFLLRGWLFWSWLSWDLCCALSHSWDFWCSTAEYHESEYLKSARCQHLEEHHIFPSWSSLLPKCCFFIFPKVSRDLHFWKN